ncbi:MAG: hypothetical protein ACRDI0_07945 [Actinomycetota bacterium]
MNGVGDLMGGSFFIGATVDEARLAWRVEQLGHRIDRLQRQRTKWASRADELERDLARAEATADRVVALREAAVPDAGVEPPRPMVPGWAVLVLSAALGLCALLVARRRRLPAVPDTVPPELLEEVAAQVPLRQPATSGGRPGIVSASPGRSSSGGSPMTKS